MGTFVSLIYYFDMRSSRGERITCPPYTYATPRGDIDVTDLVAAQRDLQLLLVFRRSLRVFRHACPVVLQRTVTHYNVMHARLFYNVQLHTTTSSTRGCLSLFDNLHVY